MHFVWCLLPAIWAYLFAFTEALIVRNPSLNASLAAQDAIALKDTADDGASNLIRTPGFKDVILRGYEIAQKASHRKDPLPIRKIRNAIPSYRPSRRLDDFITTELKITVTLPNEPFYVASLRNDPTKWNSWMDSFYPHAYRILPLIAHLTFYPRDITMDEDQAWELLARKGINGPWNIMQLCVVTETRKLAYAFTSLPRQTHGQTYFSTWTMVNVASGTVWTYKGDPCFDYKFGEEGPGIAANSSSALELPTQGAVS